MTTGMFFALILVGVIAGAISGILGIGGGIIMVPAMVYLLGFTQQQSVATSLAIMLPPVSIFAVINYYKAGFVDVKAALIIMCAFMVGSYISSKVAIGLPEHIVKKCFAVLLFVVGIKMMFFDK